MKALIFDLDDTLYNQIEPFERAVRQFFQLPGDRLIPLYLSFRRQSDQIFEDSEKGVLPMKEMHIYRMKMAFSEIGIDISDEMAYAIQQVYADQQGQLELMEGSRELFSFCLQHGIKMGLITNGPHLHQVRKIQALQLSKWIPEDLMVISGQVGVMKPYVDIFRLMEKRLQLAPKDICYLGDSFENDIIGAKTAGWKAIWFNHRERQPDNQSLTPDLTAHDFYQIKDWLKDQLTSVE